MRIISGSARGRRLAIFRGRDVRPTPDRVREALFSMLESRLGSFAGHRVLDLFAGSGALAIEALSRGAERAVLVEKNVASARIVRENLELCRFQGQARLLNRDAWQVLSALEGEGPFDLVFIDPPYHRDLAGRALQEVAARGLLAPKGCVCAETAADEELPEACAGLKRVLQRRYGNVMIHLYQFLREETP